jgi:outer membrane protein assembly factor BamB
VAIAEDEAEPSPLALTNRGTSRVQAYDLLGSQTAWGLDDVVVQKAAYALGTLVLGLRGEWRGLDPTTGQARWERQEPDTVVETVMSRGQVVSWGQQTAAGRSRRRLSAMDPVTGETLWSTALGGDHVSGLRAAGPFVLLTRARHDEGEMRQWVLVIDALTGTLRREIPFPAGRDARDLVAGPLLLQSAPDRQSRRAVTAVDLATGQARWTRALPSVLPVTALVGDGPRAWVLQSDGTLSSLATADGTVLGTTRLSVGPNARANPAFGSEPHVADGRFTLLASAVNGRPLLLSFETATGRLAWEVDADLVVRSQQQALLVSGDRFVVLLAGLDEDQARRVVVRIVDAASGRVEQRLEPEVRPSAGVVAMDGGFGTLVVLTTGGTSVYGTGPEGALPRAPEPAPAPPPGPAPAPPVDPAPGSPR